MRKGRPRIKPRVIPTEEYGFIFPAYDDAKDKPSQATPKTTPATTTSTTTLSPLQLKKVVEKHQLKLTVELRTAQMEGGNTLFKHENMYGVRYRGKRMKLEPTRNKLLCALSKVNIRGLRDGDEPFTSEGMGKYFLHEDILEGQFFNTCAVVSSAGSLYRSNNGKFIDSHDAIVRFNHAPTKGFERDVGSKTTIRILNSQILTKTEFDFWESPLYRNLTLLAWDPSNYSHSLAEWYASPDFPVFTEFFRRRLMLPKEELHLLHPGGLWRLWDTLQTFTHSRLLPNPPSSGFLGLVLMLRHCQWVDVFEYVPSIRITKQCHYWNNYTDIGCTFGGWHPLATEKLLSLLMNTANDRETYFHGYIRVPGFSKTFCST